MNKNYVIIAVFIIISAIGYFGHQKSDGPKSTTKKELQKQINDTLMAEILEGNDKEFITLLSIKHGVDVQAVESILKEFSPEAYANKVKELLSAKTNEEIEQYKNKDIISDTQNKINILSKSLNIETTKIAGVVIDYKLSNNVGFTEPYSNDQSFDNGGPDVYDKSLP